jgi:hypothetical protein
MLARIHARTLDSKLEGWNEIFMIFSQEGKVGGSLLYDHQMTEQPAETGMEIAGLTPKHFAGWLAKIIKSK